MNARLNTYLADVEGRLRPTSSEYRSENVAEIRQHLEAMIEHSVFDGHSETIATDEAIREFGHARVVGSRLRGSWQRARFSRWARSATAGGLLAFAFTFYDCRAIDIFSSYLMWLSGPAHVYALVLTNSLWMAGIGALLGYGLGRKALESVLLGNLLDVVARLVIYSGCQLAASQSVSDLFRPSDMIHEQCCRFIIWILPTLVGVPLGIYCRGRIARRRVGC